MATFYRASDDALDKVKEVIKSLDSDDKKVFDQYSMLDQVFASMISVGAIEPDAIDYCIKRSLRDKKMDIEGWALGFGDKYFHIFTEDFKKLERAIHEDEDGEYTHKMPKPSDPIEAKTLYILRCQTHLKADELIKVWDYAVKENQYDMTKLRQKFPHLLLFNPYEDPGMPIRTKLTSFRDTSTKSALKNSSIGDCFAFSTPMSSQNKTQGFPTDLSSLQAQQQESWIDNDDWDDDTDTDEENLMATAVSASKFSLKDIEIPRTNTTGKKWTNKKPELPGNISHVSPEDMQKAMMEGTGKNWDDLTNEQQRGFAEASILSSAIRTAIIPLVKIPKTSYQINVSRAGKHQIPARGKKLGRFNYNINGENVKDILGTNFLKTKFSSEAEKTAVAKEIFHLVMGDQQSSPHAQEVCMEAIKNLKVGEIVPKQDPVFTQSKNFSWKKDPTQVSVTVGGNEHHTSLVKSTMIAIGGKRFELTDSLKELRSFLEVIRDVIADNGLSSDAALRLMETVTDKELREIIIDKREENADVVEVFQLIQELVSSSGGGESAIQELTETVRRKPSSESVPLLLLRICRLCKKIHEGDPNLERRKNYSRDMALGKMKEFIKLHFPRYENSIGDHFIQARERHRENQHLGIRDEKFDELETYRKIAVSYIEMKKEDDSRYPQVAGANAHPHQGKDKRHFDKPRQVDIYATQTKEENKVQQTSNPRKFKPYQGRFKQKQNFNHASVNMVEVERQGWTNNQNGNQGFNGQQALKPAGQPQEQAGNYHCVLCNMTNHDQYHCYKYMGQTPGNIKCQNCFGMHPFECKKRPQGQAPFSQQANFRNNPPRSYQGNFGKAQQGYGQNQPQNWRTNEPQGFGDPRNIQQNQQVQQGPRAELANSGRQQRPAGVGPNTDRHRSF